MGLNSQRVSILGVKFVRPNKVCSYSNVKIGRTPGINYPSKQALCGGVVRGSDSFSKGLWFGPQLRSFELIIS